jgi:hypothetical protein
MLSCAAAQPAAASRTSGHAHTTSPRASSSLLTGVNIEYGAPGQAHSEIAAADALHAHLIRIEVHWSALEPGGPGQLAVGALDELDHLVGSAAKRHIKVIMVVDSTPCWDSSAPAPLEQRCTPGRENEANAWPPSDPSAYGAFVAYLASRYRDKLAAIEIWNEPDQANELYWAGPEKAAHYAALLKSAYPAIKAADPSLTVLGGSIVGPNGVFLRALYANGIRGYYDALAVHFYTLTLAALRETREVQLQNHDSKPLWLDEFGWSACWPHQRTQQEQACVTRKVQTENLRNTLHMLSHMPYVAAAVFYKLRDSYKENFGVLSVRGRRKPGFEAVARVLAHPAGRPARVALRLRRRARAVVATGSAPVGEFMVLEALQRGRLRYHAIFVLNRFNRYHLRLPSALGSRHLTVRVYQYGRGLSSAATRRI